ncbi:TIGR03086 family metal-binding protein [Nocardioides sp. cx-173]|uniref:TIGR03086 family metal-binding protein n=1 Tax=Nocardioides sp. cx-173 TaxID=2898796 RepID=UPI001E4ED36F|nr:TIGR03086 family metal-binding protein [Nocardioides sp. cx-173]MCD4523832.1 TIGR03086 family metal-binding protein [Nocardioides sp. cx-173]UGB41848.1 TIGR03086 family metal-binding protein [Nocardioides sp. cx-173]
MNALDGAVELLDRSLAYTRVALAAVSDDDLGRPTPCAGWDLDRLLAHMEDALDAFGEGAAGEVRLRGAATAAAPRVRRLQRKACDLLGVWSDDPPPRTRIGSHPVDTSVLALAAALEITVHGWDVARSLGLDHPVPDDLADRLLPVARALVTPADRGRRFAGPRPGAGRAGPAVRLLAFLGRDLTGPVGEDSPITDTGPPVAS